MAKDSKPTKKTVFFIVEGNTDKSALENIFRKIYKYRNIRFEFTNGDVTSNNEVTVDNVKTIISDIIKPYMKQDKLKKSDVWQIVQIFDVDGAYVPESAVLDGDSRKFEYTTSTISCNNKESVLIRNNHKKEVMKFLLEQDEINGIPYRCFFMSSNLDHALYGKQNLSEEDKKKYAYSFYRMFEGKEKLFLEYLKKDVVNGVPDSYPASWKYIQEDLHSLERHSNLHIYFIENPIL